MTRPRRVEEGAARARRRVGLWRKGGGRRAMALEAVDARRAKVVRAGAYGTCLGHGMDRPWTRRAKVVAAGGLGRSAFARLRGTRGLNLMAPAHSVLRARHAGGSAVASMRSPCWRLPPQAETEEAAIARTQVARTPRLESLNLEQHLKFKTN